MCLIDIVSLYSHVSTHFFNIKNLVNLKVQEFISVNKNGNK